MAYKEQVNLASGQVTGTLPIANGGTNATTFATSTGIVKYDGTSLVTSSTATIDASNIMTNTAQPGFLAYLNTTVNNVTGDGTNFSIIFDTEVFDQAGNFDLATSIYTSPVTAKHRFDINGQVANGTSIAGGTANWFINTSNNIFKYNQVLAAGATRSVGMGSVFCDMDIGDTANMSVQTTDTGGKIDDLVGVSAGIRNSFSGNLEN